MGKDPKRLHRLRPKEASLELHQVVCLQRNIATLGRSGQDGMYLRVHMMRRRETVPRHHRQRHDPIHQDQGQRLRQLRNHHPLSKKKNGIPQHDQWVSCPSRCLQETTSDTSSGRIARTFICLPSTYCRTKNKDAWRTEAMATVPASRGLSCRCGDGRERRYEI